MVHWPSSGWSSKISPGGAGKQFKFFAGDLNGDGIVGADDYALIDRAAAVGLTGGAVDLGGCAVGPEFEAFLLRVGVGVVAAFEFAAGEFTVLVEAPAGGHELGGAGAGGVGLG